MVALTAFFLLMAFSSSSACSRSSTSPPFCNGYDCPEFMVVEKNENYELRRYSPSTWVSTELTDMSRGEAGNEGFGRLFAYLSGENESGEKIEMTVPVTMKIQEGSNSMIESFFIPFKHQENPPTPTSGDVFISEVPEHEVYVRSFDGYADEDDYAREANALAESLRAAGVAFQEDMYMTAGYDAPFKPIWRHNEVWYKKM